MNLRGRSDADRACRHRGRSSGRPGDLQRGDHQLDGDLCAGALHTRRAAGMVLVAIRDGFSVLVAVGPDGDVLGFASFGEWRGAWPGYCFTVEHSVHVRYDVRGRGVGRALVEALFPLALALGKHVMIGGIDAENDASI